MKKGLMVLVAAVGCFAAVADIIGVAPTVTVTVTSWPDGTEVTGAVSLDYNPLNAEEVSIAVDGVRILSATNSGSFYWTPQSTGNHKLTHTAGSTVWELTVDVTGLGRGEEKTPQPPMEVVETITISQTERTLAAKGGVVTIRTAGSGEWTAAVSDDWITLISASGTAGGYVTCRVAENTDVAARTGYVYVSGRVFTLTQEGVGATLDKTDADIGKNGGTGIVTVETADGAAWRAWSNADWLSVSCADGAGSGEVTWTATPWFERSTRTGTLTIAGQTFTVRQDGIVVWLEVESATCGAVGSDVEFAVSACADDVEWRVVANDDWIHVAGDGECGTGNGSVRVTVDENRGYWERVGSVSVNRETFTITQAARPPDVAEFETAFAARGGAVTVGVTTDARVTWTVEGLTDWLTASVSEANGSGEVVLTAEANTKLEGRAAEIVIAGRTFTVTQAAREVASVGCDVTVFGQTEDIGVVAVEVEGDVAWTAEIDSEWIIVLDGASGTGRGEILFVVGYCEEEDGARVGTIRIGDKTVAVAQSARWPVEWSEDGLVVTPDAEETEVQVLLSDGFAGKVVVPSSVETVRGAAADRVVVKGGDYDITAAVEITAADGAVTVGEVKAEVLTDEVQRTFAEQVLDAAAENAEVSAVPGLVYTMVEGQTIKGMHDGDSKRADASGKVELQKTRFDGSGFYRLKVGK